MQTEHGLKGELVVLIFKIKEKVKKDNNLPESYMNAFSMKIDRMLSNLGHASV